MRKRERGWRLLPCLLALLLVAGCGPAVTPASPSATVSAAGATRISPSATLPPAATARPTASPAAGEAWVSPLPAPELAAEPLTSPLPTAGAAPEGLPLVVLHSNDNWGATEPCG